MAHHVYKTEGIILRSLPDGEANRYLQVFTSELGLVGATARSIREGKSKLRYGLQDYSVSLISLVRGKDVWRIINAVPITNFYSELESKPRSLSAAMRMLDVVQKLVAGEERHTELYNHVLEGLSFLIDADLSQHELVAFQLIFTLRALTYLGYATSESHLLYAIEGNEWLTATKEFVPHIEEARGAVRKALELTHLYQ